MFLMIYMLLALCPIARFQEAGNINTFPSGFKFGAGTSAYQIEGGWNEDGKGRSSWDWFMNEYPLFNNNSTGNIASDSYHKYKDDVAAMKEMGLDYYRFSLSWSRILPKGFSNSINQAGVDYYNKLLDELEAAGIEPMVTIYHWDTPLTLEYLGSFWTSPNMVNYFVAYADLAFSLFGNRVKLWATINEPKSFCQGIPGFFLINIFPELPIGTLEYQCVHHVLLAHARTYRLYQEKYKASQSGRISLTVDLNYNIPLTDSVEDKSAVDRRNQFEYGWFMDPLVHGDYPQIMKDVIGNNSVKQNFKTSRLPKFSCTEKKILQGAFDLFMLNTYTANLVTMAPYNNSPSFQNDEQTKTSQSADWGSTAVPGLKLKDKHMSPKDLSTGIRMEDIINCVFPEGIRHVLKYIKETYNNPEIMVTENGYSETTGPLNDTRRIAFIKNTLRQIRLAMCEDGVNVTRYTYWSLLDNLEWSRGFGPKFGLVQVDFRSKNRTRTLKNSAYFYKKLIQTRNLNITID